MNILPDTYRLAPDVADVARTLIAHAWNPVAQAQGRLERQFAHLADARLLFVLCERQVMLRGWPVQAFVAEPRVQGPFSALFDWLLAQFAVPVLETETPDFVLVFDATTWGALDARGRERLVWHELQHLVPRLDEHGVEKRDDDGRVRLRLQPHTHEFFSEEAVRYGDAADLSAAAIALAEGYRQAERQKGRSA